MPTSRAARPGEPTLGDGRRTANTEGSVAGMRRTHGNIHVLDELDRRLIEILRDDPRLSNRAMAEAVGVTDETVAARLRRMLDTGAMAMTAIVDWAAAGYGARAVARARFDGVPTSDAVKPLFEIDGVHAVSETSGCADAVIYLLGTDVEQLRQLVADHVRPLSGLSDLVVDVVTDTPKHSVGISTLPMQRWSPASLPAPVVALDELDARILEEVAVDGHESNREVARRLQVSDSTVRARLQRMESAGLIRVLAMVDPVTTGDIAGVGIVFLTLDGSSEVVLDRLVDDPTVAIVERCIGAADITIILNAPTADELHARVSHELRLMPGVRRVDLAVVVEVLMHRAHLARLV
ncbi:MAG: hypothetical protein QOH64_1693 [Acidimicrobiaceae bacterium]|jgi:DNA-binding Lrp family transcriptional regulator